MSADIASTESAATDRTLLRHAVATVAYRTAKLLRDAPSSFPEFQAGEAARTPAQILAHMGDLFDWALTMARGATQWHDSVPMAWPDECDRFFRAVEAFDAFLRSDEPLARPAPMFMQGPVADALTHTGQLALLRRLAGAPIVGENYARADIQPGRVSSEQSPPRAPFAK